MCGMFCYDDGEIPEMMEIIQSLTRLAGTHALESMAQGRMRPTDIVPVKVGDCAVVMRWGFVQPSGQVVINARSETAAQKPMFAQPLRTARCLVPATHFYEWQRMGRERVRYACRVPEQPVFYMAGLYRFEPQQTLPAFTILTRPAQGAIATIHNRMPVILPRDALDAWLSDDALAPALLQDAVTSLALHAV